MSRNIAAAVFVNAVVLGAASPTSFAVKIEISQDHADALYSAGEEAVFSVAVKDDGGALLKSGEARWTLDNFGTVAFGTGEAHLADGNPFTVRGKMDEAGFLRLQVKTAAKSAVWGVGYAVEKIRQHEPRPADFDAYWAAEKARLEREVPLDPRVALDESHSTKEYNCYRVSFATFNGKRVYGFLAVPKDSAAVPFRVRVSVPGAGPGATYARTKPGEITLVMNVHTFEPEATYEAQGVTMKRQNAALAEKYGLPDKSAYCALAGIAESREAYFYHDVMLGINRAVDWVCARPDVDLANVSYSGSSQGGGFGLFLAYLNTHFTKVFVAVCAITGHYGYKQGMDSGWPKLIAGQPPAKKPAAERNAAYFDGVNFAAGVRTPIRFLVGFADMTCPPANVYAAYNACPSGDKAIVNAIGSGHSWLAWHARSLRTPDGFDYERWLRTPSGPLALETTEEGEVHCAAAHAKFLPMQRRADGSFRGHVAKVTADASGTLRWTFATRGQNVVMLKLDASRWAGGKCASDAQTVAMPLAHEKGKNIHLTGHEARRFAFSAPSGESFSLDFGAPLRLHAMDEREWGLGTFVFRFHASNDVIAATLDTGRPLVVKEREPYVLKHGAKWIPVKVERDVEKGGALDFSTIAQGGPCRRVVARGRHFEFEDSPGVPRRFYGVNICESANFARPDVAEAFVRQLRVRGYNALRLHHHDNGMVEGSADGTTVNAAQLDRMDRLLAACGRAGIYVTTDLFVSRKVPRRAIGRHEDGFLGMDEYKALVLVNEAAFSNLCAFARQWMTHVNPCTGLRWADDPALAFLAFVNEGHVGMDGAETLRRHPEYVEAWKAWAAADGCGIAEIPSGKPWDKTPEMEAFARFAASLEMRFAERMRAFLKDELGVKALLTDMSAGMEREPFRAVRAAHYDYVDEHFYWDHPGWVNTAWRLPSKSLNTNPIKSRGADILAECSRMGLTDKPFVASEYNFSGPGEYRHMAGLVAGAEAAKEDWGAIWRFDWAGSPWAIVKPEEVRSGYFSMSGDVLAQASDRAALCLFLRGDLSVGDGKAVAADREKGTFVVKTARTAGGFTEDGWLDAGMFAASCDKEPTTIWASTLDGKAFGESRRILVSHLTDLCNDGDTYTDASRTVLLRWGRMPHLVRAGHAKIALRLAGGDFKIHALDTAGRRVREVPHTFNEKGWLCFVADVAANSENATFLYEIVSDSARRAQGEGPDV